MTTHAIMKKKKKKLKFRQKRLFSSHISLVLWKRSLKLCQMSCMHAIIWLVQWVRWKLHFVPLCNCCTLIARNDRTCPVPEKHTACADETLLIWYHLVAFFSLWLAVKFSYLAVWVIIRCSFQFLFNLCLSLQEVFGDCLVQQALSRWLLTASSRAITERELLSVQMCFRVFWIPNTVKVSLLSEHYEYT